MISTVAVGLGIVFLIYHKFLPEWVVYVERLPITFDASVFLLRPSTLVLIAIFEVQYFGWGSVLIMSENLVMILGLLKILLNETMPTLQWGVAFAVISATFFGVFSAAIEKSNSKKGETFLCAEIRPKSLL